MRTANDFTVTIEDFNWETQTSRLIELDAGGRVRTGELRLVGTEDGVRREVTWDEATEVGLDAVEHAREIAADPSFLEMEKRYSVPRLADGVLITVEVTAAGETQRVECHNRTPAPARRLIELMRELAASRQTDAL